MSSVCACPCPRSFCSCLPLPLSLAALLACPSAWAVGSCVPVLPALVFLCCLLLLAPELPSLSLLALLNPLLACYPKPIVIAKKHKNLSFLPWACLPLCPSLTTAAPALSLLAPSLASPWVCCPLPLHAPELAPACLPLAPEFAFLFLCSCLPLHLIDPYSP
jgi:hypothetical protein